MFSIDTLKSKTFWGIILLGAWNAAHGAGAIPIAIYDFRQLADRHVHRRGGHRPDDQNDRGGPEQGGVIQRERQYTLGIEDRSAARQNWRSGRCALSMWRPSPGCRWPPGAEPFWRGHYGGGTLGRQIVVDSLPHQSGGRLLVVAVNTRMADGSLQSAVEGLAQYTPQDGGGMDAGCDRAAPRRSSWAAEVPEAISDSLYGWVL